MKKLPILFNYDDVKDEFTNLSTYFSFLNREINKGTIKQIKKGLYALVDVSTGTIYANKFQIASKLNNDSFFSYHEAIEYYGFANQSFISNFNYLTSYYPAHIIFDGVRYVGKKMEYKEFVLDRMDKEGIRVATLERTVIDSIDNIGLAGGLEEVEYLLDYVNYLKMDDIIKILEKYNKSVLYQKVGYLFEKFYRDKLPKSFYDLCLSKKAKTVRYLDYSRSLKDKLNKKWNLIVREEEF